MQLITFFISALLPGTVMIWSIQAFIRGEVTIKHKFLFSVLKVKKLTGSEARRFSGFYFIGSLIMLISLSLYPFWGIQLGPTGGVICSIGVLFYALAFLTIDRSERNNFPSSD